MFKNVASQKLIVYAFNSTTNLPTTGDAANLTAYVSIDWGSVTVLADTTATEMSSTNAAGYYTFDLAQAETNGNVLLFSAKSSTSDIVVLAMPATVFTTPPNFTALAITSGGVTLADGVSHGGTLGSSTATLALSRASIVSGSSNTVALTVTGNGTGNGATFTSGAGATGNGIAFTAGSTNGHGMVTTATGTGNAFRAVSVSGDAMLTSVGTSGHGFTCAGTGTTKHGINATGGSTTSHGISATGGGVGHGILATSGAGSTGDGIRAVGASTNGNGMNLLGVGTGRGLLSTGGATGPGITASGGGTSGNGFVATAVGGGHGFQVTGVGAAFHGFQATGAGTGHGIFATSGSGATGNGIQATANSTNGSGFGLTSTGTGSGLLTDKLTVSGAVSFGSTFGVTGTVTYNAFTVTNAFTVSGATTFTGAVTGTNGSNDLSGIDIKKISGSATAATNQRDAALAVYSGSVTGTSSTTTIVDSALTQGDNFWIGRVVVFLTGSLALQGTDITDFDAATDTLTVTALTSSPSTSDTYIIV